jgi:lysophospholipase L1-like esterase
MFLRGAGRSERGLTRRFLAAAFVYLTAGCSGTQAPTSPTPPPTNTGPLLTCPSNVGASTLVGTGIEVAYTSPAVAGGRAPVTVVCSPQSGQRFPVGTTRVNCTATDASLISATCSFDVNVTQVFRISRTKYQAYGDSITAGEVTAPVGTTRVLGQLQTIFAQVLVQSAAYPTVLNDKLTQRYASQIVTVKNAGKPGEPTADTWPRYQSTFLADPPEAVLLMMGYNDIGSVASATAAYNVMSQMVTGSRDRGARVFLATLVPGIPGRQRSQPQDVEIAYNAALRSLAASTGSVLVDLYQIVLPNVNTLIGVDGLHPNEAGYAVMAQAFFDAVRADLEVR